MCRPALLAIAVALLFGAPGSVAPAQGSEALLVLRLHQIPDHGPDYTLLSVDPLTLAQRGSSLALGEQSILGWAYSADRSQLALGGSSVRIVDLASMRVARELGTGDGGTPTVLAWPAPNRVLGVEYTPDLKFVVLDPSGGKVVRKRRLRGEELDVARAGTNVVFVLAPLNRVGATRLVVGAPDGSVRSVTLRQIVGGRHFARGDVGRIRDPGLAIDQAAGRAYVVGAPGPVAEVDLRTLAVMYHYLLGAAKNITGEARQALWLGNGLVAVAGSHFGESHIGTPTGLKLLDTRTWRTTTLDPDGAWFLRSRSTLLTVKGQENSDLTTYSLDGRRLVDARFDQPFGSLDAIGGYVYTWNVDSKTMRVIDLSTGSVVASPTAEDYLELIGDRDSIDR